MLKIKLVTKKEKYNKSPNICKFCKKIIPYDKRKNIFCNSSCASTYNNQGRKQTKESKKKISKSLQKYFNIKNQINSATTCYCCNKILSNDKIFCSDKCSKKYRKIKNNKVKRFIIENNKIKCTLCGQYNCNSKICEGWYKGSNKSFFKLGFDKSKIGDITFFIERERIKTMLINEYEKCSVIELCEKYNIFSTSLYSLFKILNIKIRNRSQSGITAYKFGRSKIKEIDIYPYKSGYHTSWEGKTFWYRSSYELDYCKELDKNKIKYEMENIRIQYFDTIDNVYKTSVPDFYLIEKNEIVEIKSSWTYNEQNIKDRFKAYKEHGYICKLILEHEEKQI